MQSFRTEIENPIVEKDIIELAQKIEQFKDGKIDEEKFRSLRLARGVYGQRQQGVQMIRIKTRKMILIIPYKTAHINTINSSYIGYDGFSFHWIHNHSRDIICTLLLP